MWYTRGVKIPIFIRPLTEKEQQQVQAGLRRCQILLASVRGEWAIVIARQLGCDDQTVRNVIHCFNACGLIVLQEGSSRPHRLHTSFSEEGLVRLKDLLHHQLGARDYLGAGLRRECATSAQTAQNQLEAGQALDHQPRSAISVKKTYATG